MYWPYDPPKPPRDPSPGSEWRKKGETLSWKLVQFEDERVCLSGPGACRGLLWIDRSEFSKDWVRA